MRSLKIFYAVAFALLAIYLIAEFNRPKEINWTDTLSYQDKIPFGTYILYHEIHQLFKDAEIKGTDKTFYDQFHRVGDSTVIHSDSTAVRTDTGNAAARTDTNNVSISADKDSVSVRSGTDSVAIRPNANDTSVRVDTSATAVKSNYIIIANTVNISKYDYQEMVRYMKEGNSIFIATNDFPFNGMRPSVLADTLKFQLSEPKPFGKRADSLYFTNTKLKQAAGSHFDKGVATQYFESFDTARAVVLCKNHAGYPTMLRYSFGKGNLFLCANPKLFTNYTLLKVDGADYAAKALSYLPAEPLIYWDHLQNHDIPEDESPVRVFFSNPSLEWAYYLALFGMVGFVLYEMKRRQRIIPIIEPLANSTVDFVNVVGRVYYEQRNNTNIAQKKIMYFLEHLRTTYYLKTSKLDKEFIERLSQKTGIDYAFAEELVAHIHYITGQRVGDQDLIKLNQLIEQFYIKSR